MPRSVVVVIAAVLLSSAAHAQVKDTDGDGLLDLIPEYSGQAKFQAMIADWIRDPEITVRRRARLMSAVVGSQMQSLPDTWWKSTPC